MADFEPIAIDSNPDDALELCTESAPHATSADVHALQAEQLMGASQHEQSVPPSLFIEESDKNANFQTEHKGSIF